MVRTQIQLTEQQAAMLKQLSQEQQVSIAELIRSAIDTSLKSIVGMEQKRERALKAVGRYRSGVADLSSQHDTYIAEAFSK